MTGGERSARPAPDPEVRLLLHMTHHREHDLRPLAYATHDLAAEHAAQHRRGDLGHDPGDLTDPTTRTS